MKLYFLLARRDPPQPSQIIVDVSRILAARGMDVRSGIAEERIARPDEPAGESDLFLLKSYTELSMSMAGVLDAQGARLLNPYPACMAARNKIIAAQVLSRSGIPAPRCWVTADRALVEAIAGETAIVIKPYMGWRGEGVSIVRDPQEFRRVEFPQGPFLVQEYVEGSGEDLRLYVAGESVFAVKKPFSAGSFAVPGRPVPLLPAWRDIALRVGQAFGLGLYGMDLIETPTGPKVVDVNYFPGYKGIPGAAEVVAGYIEQYAAGKQELSPAAVRRRAA